MTAHAESSPETFDTEPTADAAAPAVTDPTAAAAANDAPAAEAPEAEGAPAPDRPGSAVAAQDEWGRVDESGAVFVRSGQSWRQVGEYPDAAPEEALAYYRRKYSDLADKVTLLEQRHKRGGAATGDVRTAAKRLSAELVDAAAVGDLPALEHRLQSLAAMLSEASATEAAVAREAVDEALRARTAVVEQAEQLAARDPKSIQWKQTSGEITALFDQWQQLQQHGPRLPKAAAQELWRRLRDARAVLDRHRREFYAGLDEAHKGARDLKARLVDKAEALAVKGEDGIPAYRELLEAWKTSGRAGKKVDDALWARFKAAGDALYGARAEQQAAEAEASRAKIESRRGLLHEAKAVAGEADVAAARTLLTGIQRRWDEVGRIFPREQERALDDELRRIEQALRTREEADWKRNDPATKARADDMTRQLTDAIDKLEAEAAAAVAAGDATAAAKAEEALRARRAWLAALGG